MADYSRLPTLVLNEIFGYLSVKEQIRCKAVCRTWNAEIEQKEKVRDALVLHMGQYLRNMRWTHTNNRGLMKFENSFEVKRLSFLQHPLTRTLLKKIKKLAIVNYHPGAVDAEIAPTNVHPYIRFFDQCLEIEISAFHLRGTVTFELPRLKALVIRECPTDKLVLNCPSLELLYWDWPLQEVCFRSTKSLNRLFCFGWKVSPNVKFQRLVYLNLYTERYGLGSDRLLGQMPKLKRLVLNSNDLQADLENIREQQKRYGRQNLEVLCSGFTVPVEFVLNEEANCYVRFEKCTDELFENYSKLVENWPWKVWIDYSKLFNKFKILPSDFFERFNEPYGIDISAVTSYTHLYGFLKCYPFIQQMKIDWQSVKADLILGVVHLLSPSLRELTIVEKRVSHVLDIDMAFMHLFDLVYLQLVCNGLPVEFIRRVAAKRGAHFNGFTFIDSATYHKTIIYMYAAGFAYYDYSCGSKFTKFASLEQLIASLRADPHFGSFLYGV